MPVEIKEMVIRANIRHPEEPEVNGRAVPSMEQTEADRTAAIVEQCVEQVMEILRKDNER